MAERDSGDLRGLVEQILAAPINERQRLIEEACADDPARKDTLVRLLAASDAPTRVGGGLRAAVEQPGDAIGRYTLLEIIGEGGFGVVYRAQQEEPVRREVALKIIKLGMDTAQVIGRFEAERQALAVMDHPNIAKVLDAGATEAGRPYFVMELVRGIPITDYCDDNTLDVRERLDLFQLTCMAVQHAHQKGIIHRDLKPSNVLVTLQDGTPVPKVIDFGIAKATEQHAAEQTVFTQEGQFIGTPEYMSPEQTGLTSGDIDTRSDVYSLGVLLYELLTGTRPFDSTVLRRAGLAEIQRIIREEDPQRPSTRIGSLGQARATTGPPGPPGSAAPADDTIVAAPKSATAPAPDAPSGEIVAKQRRSDPKTLTRFVRGDLDWIIMKALEKDRGRRYETANGFAADIGRHLRGEPVVAAPPSAAYRARKFVRRNKAGVTAGVLVATTLVLGIAGTTLGMISAKNQRDIAEFNEGVAKEQTQRAEDESARALAAEAETRQRADELQQVVDFQGEMLAQIDATAAGVRLTQDVRERFDASLAKSGTPDDDRAEQVEAFVNAWSRVNATDAALAVIDTTVLAPAVAAIEQQFADQPAVGATLRDVLASRYHGLGFYAAALPLEERALEDRQQVLGEEHPDTLSSLNNMGVFLSALGRYDDAEPYFRDALEKGRRVHGSDAPETLEYVSSMGGLFRNQGKLSEAEPFVREALDGRRRVLGEAHPDTLWALNNWGAMLEEQGQLAEAEAVYREVLARRRTALGEDDRDTLASINNLAVLLEQRGTMAEAIAFLRELVEKRRRILGESHPDTLNAIQNLGATLNSDGQREEAETLLREALEGRRQLLGADHPNTLTSLGNFSVLLINQQRWAEAEEMCRETLERRRRVLGNNHPETLIANNVMGLALARQGKLVEAEPYWREALDIAKRTLGAEHPESLIYGHNLAMLMKAADQPGEAETLLRAVIAEGTAGIGAGHPTVLSASQNLGLLLLDLDRDADAVEAFSTAEPFARETYTGRGERLLATFLTNLGRALNRVGQRAEAESLLLEANTINETLDSTRLLVEFYTTWNEAEPGQGYDTKAADWQAKVDELTPPEPDDG